MVVKLSEMLPTCRSPNEFICPECQKKVIYIKKLVKHLLKFHKWDLEEAINLKKKMRFARDDVVSGGHQIQSKNMLNGSESHSIGQSMSL